MNLILLYLNYLFYLNLLWIWVKVLRACSQDLVNKSRLAEERVDECARISVLNVVRKDLKQILKETGITRNGEESRWWYLSPKTEEKDALKSVPNAYQMYLKMWREARDRGEDMTFADVRRIGKSFQRKKRKLWEIKQFLTSLLRSSVESDKAMVKIFPIWMIRSWSLKNGR